MIFVLPCEFVARFDIILELRVSSTYTFFLIAARVCIRGFIVVVTLQSDVCHPSDRGSATFVPDSSPLYPFPKIPVPSSDRCRRVPCLFRSDKTGLLSRWITGQICHNLP